MANESLIADALKTAGVAAAEKASEKGVKAIRKLPKGKRKKVAGIVVFIATVIFLVLASKRIGASVE